MARKLFSAGAAANVEMVAEGVAAQEAAVVAENETSAAKLAPASGETPME